MKLAALTASALVLVAGVANASDLGASNVGVTRDAPAALFYSAREQAQLNQPQVQITNGIVDQVAASSVYSAAERDDLGLASNDSVTLTEFPRVPSTGFHFKGR